MKNMFLGIGINRYDGAPLNGCVNDIKRCIGELVAHHGFSWEGIDSCTDLRATAFGIKHRLARVVDMADDNSTVLIWYSGHGAQMTRRAQDGSVFNRMEVLCPVDFGDNPEDNCITDVEFTDLFSATQYRNKKCIVVLDSCYSGGMYDINRKESPFTRNYKYQNIDYIVRNNISKDLFFLGGVKLTRTVSAFPNVAVIEMCGEDQLSAETQWGADFGGVGTKYFWDALAEDRNQTVRGIVDRMRKNLAKDRWGQVPQVIGDDAILDEPFFPKC